MATPCRTSIHPSHVSSHHHLTFGRSAHIRVASHKRLAIRAGGGATSSLFAAAGVWSLISGAGYAEWAPRVLAVPLIAGLGAYILNRSPTIFVSADERARSIVIRRRGFRRDERVEIPLREITDIAVREEEDSEGHRFGHMDVVLRSGDREGISEIAVGEKEIPALTRIATDLRTVLRLRGEVVAAES